VCTCIALVVEKQVVVGVVHNPILGETFTAERGCGAFLNGEPISVSGEAELEKALVCTEIGVHRDFETMMAIMERIMKLSSASRSMRACGSCAMNMCGVAMGRLDGFFEIGFGGCWDVAAASLIVREAGGKVLDPSGQIFDIMGRRVLATNGHLATPMSSILGACFTGPSEPEAAGNK
jgi:inositol-phosphate phosphatase/L-galactose 1-phosphate phosphatase